MVVIIMIMFFFSSICRLALILFTTFHSLLVFFNQKTRM